jgi:hypothetical protein
MIWHGFNGVKKAEYSHIASVFLEWFQQEQAVYLPIVPVQKIWSFLENCVKNITERKTEM